MNAADGRVGAFLCAALVVLLFLLCLLLALLGAPRPARGPGTRGGAAPSRPRRRGPDYARSPHIVVDTLNLVHWRLERLGRGRGGALTPAKIVEAIDATAPALKLRHPGRVVYVLKDRESQFNDEAAREVYRQAAVRNGVFVCVAERYEDPPAGAKPSAEHSSRGRDDFYMSLLAYRYRCAVLTEDRLRDFSMFRGTIPPFHVLEYAFWRELPHREFIRPDAGAFQRIKKPRTIRPADYFDI